MPKPWDDSVVPITRVEHWALPRPFVVPTREQMDRMTRLEREELAYELARSLRDVARIVQEYGDLELSLKVSNVLLGRES